MPKQRVCPKCKSDDITLLLWGLPNFSDELQKEIDKGKIELRGCVIYPHSKQFRCNNCCYEWGNL